MAQQKRALLASTPFLYIIMDFARALLGRPNENTSSIAIWHLGTTYFSSFALEGDWGREMAFGGGGALLLY